MAIYSHPVLRIDTDDVTGSVTFSPPRVDNKKLILESITIDNDEIKERISNGSAAYALYIENSSSFFSKTFQFSDDKYSVYLNPEEYPQGKYLMELMVVANKGIIGYELDSFHNDYKGQDFNLKTGDLIAYLGVAHFEIDKNYPTLNESESIFDFEQVPDDDIKGRSHTYFGQGKIKIQVHEDDMANILQKMLGIDVNYIYLVYVLPALSWALHKLKADIVEAEEESRVSNYEEEPWALSISASIERLNLSILDNPVLLAHKLLESPLVKSSETIINIATRGDSDDED
jgi:hypothetical protein